VATTAFVQAAGGLVLITTETFSAVSAVSLNNVFTSVYQNYRIVIKINADAAREIRCRYRAAGADDTNSRYFLMSPGLFQNGTVDNYSNLAQTSLFIGYAFTTDIPLMASYDIFDPQLTTTVSTAGVIRDVDLTGTAFLRGGTFTSWTNAAVSYDGITLFPSAGTITGNIRIYGYKNS
jgi:hypothetical protein